VARAFSRRKYIVKFEGCYHGHADSLLVKAGSGVATLGIPGSAGVLEEQAQFTLALPFNNQPSVEEAFQKFKDRIACVIVEPVAGNMGCVPPREGYLQFLRKITAGHGAVLLLDEVMTGFRLSLGGAQQLFGVKPDITTLGKIIGGGLPVGAYGGRAEIMDLIAPLGPVYQAGTLSGNPLAMAAGLATLRELKNNPAIYTQLEQRSSALVQGVLAAAQKKGVPLWANRQGSMFTWFFQPGPVVDWETAAKSDTQAFARFHRGMLERGIYLPPSQFEAMFMSAAHTEEDVAKTIAAAEQAMSL
jgi:glutamate-1-semialdehyde 2,1-aminomutase